MCIYHRQQSDGSTEEYIERQNLYLAIIIRIIARKRDMWAKKLHERRLTGTPGAGASIRTSTTYIIIVVLPYATINVWRIVYSQIVNFRHHL